MRVINLSSNDYANMSHNNARALRAVGVECDDYCLNLHPFGYESQSQQIRKQHIPVIVGSYDVVQIFHTCPVILEEVLKGDPKKIVVYHSGSRYRDEPERFNELFNKHVYCSFTDHCEFIGLGAKNLHYIAPHVELSPVEKRKDGPIIIGHYPSNAEVKGTKEILEMVEPFKHFFEFRIDYESNVSHSENLKRMAECHVYIELFKPELNGKPYGHYGVTAFEATSLGCKVITQNLHPEVYQDVYGESPFFLANTREKFSETLYLIRNWHVDAFLPKKKFFDSHSIHSTGARILDKIK